MIAEEIRGVWRSRRATFKNIVALPHGNTSFALEASDPALITVSGAGTSYDTPSPPVSPLPKRFQEKIVILLPEVARAREVVSPAVIKVEFLLLSAPRVLRRNDPPRQLQACFRTLLRQEKKRQRVGSWWCVAADNVSH